MYVFSYFRTQPEALHLAISQDGWVWKALNGNRPILEGTVGARGLRDPFIVQDHDAVFHLFTSNAAKSQDIVHATSADLVCWSDQELIPVMADVPGARNAWASECFYDREVERYRIIWSSTVSLDGPPDLLDHRIWGTTTRDFQNYSPAALFFDPGFNMIDATVAHHHGKYLMAFKDEREKDEFGRDLKAIRVAMADSAGGPFVTVSDLVTPSYVEGPCVFRCHDRWIMLYDHWTQHHYGASTSEDGLHWQVCTDAMTFPPGPRHGAVLEVADDLGGRLIEKLG